MNISIEGVFLCEVCGFDLADNEDADGVKGEEDKMASFNLKTAWIEEGLRKTGEIIFPAYVQISSYLSSVSRWVEYIPVCVAKITYRQRSRCSSLSEGNDE
jgi:hypothetical protein